MLQQVMTNGRNYFQRGSGSGGKGKSGFGKDYEYWYLWIRYSCLSWKTSVYKISVTQGHEVSGEITELGKNVTEFHVGQKVTIEPQVYCGHCYPCRHGKYNLCEELKVRDFRRQGQHLSILQWIYLK